MRVAFLFQLLGKNVTDEGWPVELRVKFSPPLIQMQYPFPLQVGEDIGEGQDGAILLSWQGAVLQGFAILFNRFRLLIAKF